MLRAERQLHSKPQPVILGDALRFVVKKTEVSPFHSL